MLLSNVLNNFKYYNNYNLKYIFEEISWNVFNNVQYMIFIYILSILIYSLFKLNTLILKKNNINPLSLYLTIINVYLILYIFMWSGQTSNYFFNNLILNLNTYKITLFILFTFFFINLLTNNVLTLHTKINMDLYSYKYFLTFWLINLFYCVNLFTLVFYIELISITLFIILSLTNNYNYFNYNSTNNLNIEYNYIKPFYQIYSLIVLFWINFITSFNLFFYLIYFLYFLQTFNFIIMEHIFLYLIYNFNLLNLFNIYFIVFGLSFTIFLKLGLIPFFFWKPNFFKGVQFNFLEIYILFFYFIFLIFIITFLIKYFNDFINLIIILNLIIINISIIFLILMLFDVTNIKIFLAYSSILNTVLLFIYIFLNINQNIQVVYF